MKFENFESAGKSPEIKDDSEKETPLEREGRFYLTKIAHLLLPENIPDMNEIGETRVPSVSESEKEEIIKEIGAKMSELDMKLGDIGFGFSIDEDPGNYSKSETGGILYLQTFKPWQADLANPKEIELLFDEGGLREAIGKIKNESEKEQCNEYLEKLLALAEEEKKELVKSIEARLVDAGPHIEEFNALVDPFLAEGFLGTLNAIKTEEEAKNSAERRSAKEAILPILKKLKFLSEETRISKEEYGILDSKYRTLSRAVGIVNRGEVDHNR